MSLSCTDEAVKAKCCYKTELSLARTPPDEVADALFYGRCSLVILLATGVPGTDLKERATMQAGVAGSSFTAEVEEVKDQLTITLEEGPEGGRQLRAWKLHGQRMKRAADYHGRLTDTIHSHDTGLFKGQVEHEAARTRHERCSNRSNRSDE